MVSQYFVWLFAPQIHHSSALEENLTTKTFFLRTHFKFIPFAILGTNYIFSKIYEEILPSHLQSLTRKSARQLSINLSCNQSRENLPLKIHLVLKLSQIKQQREVSPFHNPKNKQKKIKFDTYKFCLWHIVLFN